MVPYVISYHLLFYCINVYAIVLWYFIACCSLVCSFVYSITSIVFFFFFLCYFLLLSILNIFDICITSFDTISYYFAVHDMILFIIVYYLNLYIHMIWYDVIWYDIFVYFLQHSYYGWISIQYCQYLGCWLICPSCGLSSGVKMLLWLKLEQR